MRGILGAGTLEVLRWNGLKRCLGGDSRGFLTLFGPMGGMRAIQDVSACGVVLSP